MGNDRVKKRWLEVLYTVMGVVLIAYFSYQLYLFVDKPYDTETAVLSDYSLDVNFNGYFVRDEKVVPVDKQGVVSYKYEDGQKVTSTTKVAEFYKSEQDIVNVKQIEKYNAMISMLEDNQSEGSIKGARIDLVVSQVEQNQIEYISMIDEKNFSDINTPLNNFSNYLNKLQVVKNQGVDYDKTIKSLEEKVKNISKSENAVIGSAKSPGSGYFSSHIDGLESKFTVDSLKDMSYDTLSKNLKANVKTESPKVGKLVSSNEWYYVTSIDAKRAKGFYVGQPVSVKFLSNINQEVKTNVHDIIYDEGGKKAVMIFESDILSEDIINARFAKATIVTSKYKGVAVSKDTVRFKDGEKGVYILVAGMPVFKKIDTLYEDDDIIISRSTADQAYLSQYDQVIVKGKNLYEQPPKPSEPSDSSSGSSSNSSEGTSSSSGSSSSSSSSQTSSSE